jgi:hypothetical protein
MKAARANESFARAEAIRNYDHLDPVRQALLKGRCGDRTGLAVAALGQPLPRPPLSQGEGD